MISLCKIYVSIKSFTVLTFLANTPKNDLFVHVWSDVIVSFFFGDNLIVGGI
jgi:hypothetical protein